MPMKMHANMTCRWESGIESPRLGMCALNPHNGENGAFGRQEIDHIRPAVEAARQKGIDIQGPFPCDTIFLKREHFDGIVTMYHDQGHIAVKTWGFVGNCAMILGLPYLQFSVGHGTAFDIVGQSLARHEMILSAMTEAASLAAGRGFRPVGPTPA